MNQPDMKHSPFVPVPWVCNAVIQEKMEGSSSYYITIDKTPLCSFQGPIPSTPICVPGIKGEYKNGDRVKALVVFHYNTDNDKFEGVARNYQTHILGMYEPEALIDVDIQNPASERGDEQLVIKNEKSQAGVTMTNNYELIETPGGAVSQTMKAFGAGIYKNSHYIRAQNFHRIVSHNDPEYFSREHFGMFAGKTLDDEALNALPDNVPINYRRFVQQTRDPGRWVSTCEGAYAPWLAANNNHDSIAIGKEVLFTKLINYDTSRITCEMGEPGPEFVMLRIDDILTSEKTAPTDYGATPGLVGNKFKIAISDTGAVEIFAAGKGLPGANISGFKMKITEDGELTILAAKKITLTHGDADANINSIVLDPANGIDITAMSGFRVNGKKLLNENFLDWFVINAATFGLVTGPSLPVTIAAPVALLEPLKIAPDKTVGILTTTSIIPVPSPGVIAQPDVFSTT